MKYEMLIDGDRTAKTTTPIFTLTLTAEGLVKWGIRGLWFLAGGIVFGILNAILSAKF